MAHARSLWGWGRRKGRWGGCSGKGQRTGEHPPLLSCCASICWSVCVSSRSRRCAWKVRAAMSSPQQRSTASFSCLQSERVQKKNERYTCRSVIYMKLWQDSTVKCAISVPLASPFGTAKWMFSNRFPDHSPCHWLDNQTTLPQIYGTGWASAAVPGWTRLLIQTEQCSDFKGLVHPKIKIMSLITHSHVVPNP